MNNSLFKSCPSMHRPLSPRGLTLIELLLVTAIVGILAAIVVPMSRGQIEKARLSEAIVGVREIELKITSFMALNGAPPDTLDQVGMAGKLDPWGNPYQYLRILGVPPNEVRGQWRKDRFLVPINSDFDLYSEGADGTSTPPITARASRDDIIRAGEGNYIGLASDY